MVWSFRRGHRTSGRCSTPRTVVGIFAALVAISQLTTVSIHAQAVAPASYTANSNRTTYNKPSLPALGGAGAIFSDPTFGSSMLRVTDPNTRPGAAGQSYTTPSAAHQTAWNADSTYFYVRSVDGYFIPYAFNPSTMRTSRVQATSSGAGGLVVSSQAEPQFSFVSPSTLYVTGQDPSNDWPIVRRFDFSSGSYSDLLNLGQVAPIARSTYTGGLSSSAGSPERVMAFFGGSGQDSHYLVAVFPVAQPQSVLLLDTTTSTLTVNGSRMGTNIPLNFHLHHAWMDKSGQYVVLESTAPDRGSPNYAAPLYVWDTYANRVTALPQNTSLSGGHYATGFGMMVNQDCCTSTSWDAAQWQLRTLSNPTANQDLIGPVLTPQEVYASDHTSWNNAQAGSVVPFVSGFYRSTSNTAPWRPWDDEIVAVQTNAGTGATVWRFAHHRTIVDSFWDMPRPNVSQDGRWALFTSNWEHSLGSGRVDVFMVSLAASSSAAPPSSTPTPTPTPAPPTAAPTPVPAPAPTPTAGTTPSSYGTIQRLQWASLINTTASTTSVTKTGGCGGCADGTAVSAQQIASGNGGVQFVAADSTLRVGGLGEGSMVSDLSSLRFAIRLQGSTAEVRESGAYRFETSFAPGDTFWITNDSGLIRYWKNRVAFYTSTSAGNTPLRVQAILFDMSGTLGDMYVATGVTSGASTAQALAAVADAPTPAATTKRRP